MKTKIILMSVTVFISLSAFAEIFIYMHNGSTFNKVAIADVENECGKNFLFRSEGKEQAPKYLGKEIIKAAFLGKMLPSFSAVLSSAKASKNKCFWVMPEERIFL